jgi:predicted aspartyl protease
MTLKFNPPWEDLPISFVDNKPERNPHGSITLTPFLVKSMDRAKVAPLVGIADTGAIYSSIPLSVASELGLIYINSVPIITIDGRTVITQMFSGIIDIQGKEVGTTFSSMADGPILIGVTDLEKLGFKVNPVTGKLETIPIYG